MSTKTCARSTTKSKRHRLADRDLHTETSPSTGYVEVYLIMGVVP